MHKILMMTTGLERELDHPKQIDEHSKKICDEREICSN